MRIRAVWSASLSLDSIIPQVSISEISNLKLISVAEQAGWLQTLEDRFFRDEAQIN